MKYCLYRAMDGTENLVEFVPIENFWDRIKALAKCEQMNRSADENEHYFVGLNKH